MRVEGEKTGGNGPICEKSSIFSGRFARDRRKRSAETSVFSLIGEGEAERFTRSGNDP